MTAALIARLTAATGPDRELDARIWAHFDGRMVREFGGMLVARHIHPPCDECLIGSWVYFSGDRAFEPVGLTPFYTSSLDAAVALVERGLPGCGVWIDMPSDHVPRRRATAYISQSEQEWTYHGWPTVEAPTAPLAILAALFKAMEAKAALVKAEP